MIEVCKNKFLELNVTQKITWLIILIGITVYFTRDIEKAAQTGDFLAGFAGALAFLWLIAGFKQQQNEIKMQRKALELQALELKNANKISTYNHIQQLTTEALSELNNSNIKIKEHSELFNVFIKELSFYDEIFSNSTDKEQIVKAWMEWWKIEQTLNMFISKVSFSLKLYIEYKTNIQTTQKMDIIFIEQHIEEMNEIPYLEQFYGTMSNLIIPMKMTKSYFNKFRLAGTLALMIDQDENLKEEMDKKTFKELLESLDANNVMYPAIYKLYKRKTT